MQKDSTTNHAFVLLIATVVAYVAGRLFGGQLFDNNWSFTHWQHLSGWYPLLWSALLVFFSLLFVGYFKKIAGVFTGRLVVWISAAVVFGLLMLFQFDSFIYGGGNLRVAQIAQAPKIIFRWFEFGTVMFVSWAHWLFSLFDLHDYAPNASNIAGVWGWKLLAFLCALLSMAGSLKLAKELTKETARRFYLFVILFFGPQTILYFGFVGVEPVVVAVSTWFALLTVRVDRRFATNRLLMLWGITLLGVVLHFSLIFLLPAAVYVTLRHTIARERNRAVPALVAGLAVWALLVILVYYLGNRSFEFSRYLLFLKGKSPFGDYGLVSARRIGDVIQLLFLAFPIFVVVMYLAFRRLGTFLENNCLVAACLMGLSGITVVVILDPFNSIVFDFPRMVAYLTPLAFLAALLVSDIDIHARNGKRLLGVLAAVSLLFPLAYIPTYLKINLTDPYTAEYFDKHEPFYYNVCLAYRDAYFYNQNLFKANAWEWAMPTKSSDDLNLRGARDLVVAGEIDEAIGLLYAMKTKHPYWSEPRILLANLQMQYGRHALAKPEIDTVLMIEPYRKDSHTILYAYYRDTRNYVEALKAVARAVELFPGDLDIFTDLMIINYRAGAHRTADSLANVLIQADDTLPYPYLIKGMCEDARKNYPEAVKYYDEFVFLAPEAPEADKINERLVDLISKLKEN